MGNIENKLNNLEKRLILLINQQNEFTKEVANIKQEINALKKQKTETDWKEVDLNTKIASISNTTPKEVSTPKINKSESLEDKKLHSVEEKIITPKKSINLEKFIGENLMNKIGIAITVIGIAIGTKYSIEHDLISPLTRIILGYLCGIVLLLVGMKLRPKYENYSAVLVSGAMATMYFITFSAYNFFDLLPQFMAFALMVIFTIFTVIASLSYNRQIIAHIGMVGAYAIPFLLSNNSGNILVLFSYMTIINAGILFVSLKKYWKQLYYVSFGLSWLIFASWYIPSFSINSDTTLALAFSSIFFILFYTTFLGYKLIQNEVFKKLDIILLLSNSFIFYSIGYSILNQHEAYEQLLGLFTLCNGIVHFIVGLFIHKKKLADKNLYFLVIGLVLVFVTIAIPVQLDGNWVTLLWLGQTALLYWIGKTKKVSFYEALSYPLMIISFISLLQDWVIGYPLGYEQTNSDMMSIININFLTSLIAIISFGFLLYINRKEKSILPNYPTISNWVNYIIPGFLLFIVYYSFKLEISFYWNKQLATSLIEFKEDSNYYNFFRNHDITKFKTIWLYNYSFLFTTIIYIINTKKIKSVVFGYITAGIGIVVITLFLTHGIYTLGELRDSFINPPSPQFYNIGFFHIGIRYIIIIFLAFTIYFGYWSLLTTSILNKYKMHLELFVYGTILVLISNELITWLSVSHYDSAYKTTLSILFGIYALSLIVMGIIQKKQYLRYAAISLFGATLLKLFFYDLSNLSTIEKTVVFVSLGILLLIISFLYNKYKPLVNE